MNLYEREHFAERITEILKNPSMAKEMGDRGRKKMRKYFFIPRLLSDYLDLLNELTE